MKDWLPYLVNENRMPEGVSYYVYFNNAIWQIVRYGNEVSKSIFVDLTRRENETKRH